MGRERIESCVGCLCHRPNGKEAIGRGEKMCIHFLRKSLALVHLLNNNEEGVPRGIDSTDQDLWCRSKTQRNRSGSHISNCWRQAEAISGGREA